MWNLENITEEKGSLGSGGWLSWRHFHIFFLQNHSFLREITCFLEYPRTFSSGPSVCMSSQRRIASKIHTEYRGFIMRTKSSDVSLSYKGENESRI